VHVNEDRRNGASLARRFRFPGGTIKFFEENLVHTVTGDKDPHCRSAELSVNLALSRGHRSLLLRPYRFMEES
jgi:hypothetical protein